MRLGGQELRDGEVPAGFKTPQQGAATSVLDNNGYMSGLAPYALDPSNADRLWDVSLRLLGEA